MQTGMPRVWHRVWMPDALEELGADLMQIREGLVSFRLSVVNEDDEKER